MPEPTNVREVLAKIRTIVDVEANSNSRLALFPALYAELTESVIVGLAEGQFREPILLERLAIRFAQRYFDALAALRAGQPPTRSWRLAFEQAQRGRLLLIQDLILGINAHINLDLGIATAEVAEGKLERLEADFGRINELLENLFDATQGVISRHSPLMDILDRLGHEKDEWLGNFAIARARDAAWKNARILTNLDRELWPQYISLLDVATERLGCMVVSPGLVTRAAVELVHTTEERDVRVLVKALSEVHRLE